MSEIWSAQGLPGLPGLLTTAFVVVAMLIGMAPGARAGGGTSSDCYDQLENGTAPEIACRVPLRLAPAEQAELEKGSRGYVKNVACTLTVKLARADIEAAIAASDHVFQSPAQPVVCTVTTHKSSFEVTATFAPRIVIKGGVATEASPGLGNVKGVSRVLSWPVVQFVNRWPSIRAGFLQVVDAYRAHKRKQKAETTAR